MSDNIYTTKSRKFQHLSKEKHTQIQILLDSAIPKVKITKADLFYKAIKTLSQT